MKKIFSILIFMLFVSSCSAQKRVQSSAYNFMLKTLLSNSVTEISVDSLKQVQDSIILLDARAPEEYSVSHINNALYVGYERFESTAVDSFSRDQPVVVYCSVGYRSEKISEKLIAMGFTNVANLYGGIFEWKNSGNIVVNKNGPTEKVHAYNKTWGIWLKKGEKVYE